MITTKITVEEKESGVEFEIPLYKKSFTVKKTLVGDGAYYQKSFNNAFVSSVDFDKVSKTVVIRLKYDFAEEKLQPEE